jgi:hypothetical protein
MHWHPDPRFGSDDSEEASRWDRWMRPLYWLAGARWETVQHCPPSERERIAVLGSTVLIPTIMSFLGMIFYAKSRFHEPPWLAVTGIALAWAFVIMNTDRILLATYRPFQPWWRRFAQVCFRLGLAGVVSVAIAFPFCLDQYRPAIRNRYQAEVQVVLNQLRADEAAGRKTLREALQKIRDDGEAERARLVREFDAAHATLTAQLPELQKAIVNPEAYADERMEEERRKAGEPDFVAPASGATRGVMAQIDAQKETLAKTKAELESGQDLHRRLVEAIAREGLGLPNEFYPEPKKPGEGPRLKDMQGRDRRVMAEIRATEASERAQQEALLASDKQLAAARLADKNAYLDALITKRAAFVAEGEEKERIRKEQLAKVLAQITTLETDHAARLAKLREHIASQEADQALAQKRHDETFLAPIARREAQIAGVLDPMEETIGLYKVIFLPPVDASATERRDQDYKWIAGLFQFLVIFGTLFVLDLVPIMAKIFSRPGPYDVLVEHPEFIAHENLLKYRHAYRAAAWDGAEFSEAEPEAKRLLQSRKLLPDGERKT